MPLAFFLICVAVFLGLTIVAYSQIKKEYSKRMAEANKRYRQLEAQHEKILTEYEQEQVRCRQLSEEAGELAAQLREREHLLKKLLPARMLTPLDALRMKKIVRDEDIQAAREYIVKNQVLMDVEEALVHIRKISPDELQEFRELTERFNSRKTRVTGSNEEELR